MCKTDIVVMVGTDSSARNQNAIDYDTVRRVFVRRPGAGGDYAFSIFLSSAAADEMLECVYALRAFSTILLSK